MKEKKPIYKRVWFIALIVIIVISVGSSFGGDSKSSSSNNAEKTSSEKTTKNEEKSYHVGELVVVGDVEYIVNSISTAKTVGGEYLSSNSKGTYLLINVTVKNNGNKELYVDGSLFKLVNGEKEYDSDSSAGMYANESGTFFLENINPDLSTTGNVVFDVSDETISAEDLQLRVQTGAWGSEKELIYLNK